MYALERERLPVSILITRIVSEAEEFVIELGIQSTCFGEEINDSK
jgi:hypothetical protein